ncbi:MAG: PAS domain S-box protein [Chloroflexi bacterium]|nr:PAS domain S-box protein [Chloroflexota bacterium]
MDPSPSDDRFTDLILIVTDFQADADRIQRLVHSSAAARAEIVQVSPEEASKVVAARPWDVVILSLSPLSSIRPADVIADAQQSGVATRFVVAGADSSPEEITAVVRLGVCAFVESSDTEHFMAAVRHELEYSRLRRRARTIETALRVSEAGYESVVEHQTELICRYDRDFRLTFVNQSYAEWSGQPREALLGSVFLERIPEEERRGAIAHVQRLTVEHPVAVTVHQTIMADSSRRWIEWTDRALFDVDGQVIGYQGVGRDITDRKLAQHRLEFLHQLLKETYATPDLNAALENALALVCKTFPMEYGEIWLLDPATVSLKVAPAHYLDPSQVEMLRSFRGMSELLEFGMQQGVPALVWATGEPFWASDVQMLSTTDFIRIEAAKAAGLHGLIALPVTDGEQVIAALVFIGKQILPQRTTDDVEFLSMALQQIAPILRRQQLDETLKASEEKYRSLLESSDAAISMVDVNGRYLYLNGISAYPYGVPPEVLIGKTVYDLFPAQQADSIMRDVNRVIQSEESIVLETEVTLGHTPAWFRTSIQPIRNGKGKVYAALIYATNITEKHLATTGLAEANALLEQRVAERTAELGKVKNRLEAIFEHSGDGILLLDITEGVLQANHAFGVQTGIDPAAALGRKLSDFVESSEVEIVETVVRDSAEAHLIQQMDTRLRHANGRSFDAEISIAPVNRSLNPTTSLVCIIRDVSERKRNEQTLAEKHQETLKMQLDLKALHEVGIQLARTESLDDFYRTVVEQGLARFGYERMGLLLYDVRNDSAVGTYGTDRFGELVNESAHQVAPDELNGILQRTRDRGERFAYEENIVLYDSYEPIGVGANAAAALWDGELLGWLSVDNGVLQRPITKHQLDVLALYAMTVGSLLARKRAEQKALSLSQRLDLATQISGIGIWEYDVPNNRLLWDDRMYVLFDLVRSGPYVAAEEMIQRVHPDDVPRVLGATAGTLATRAFDDAEFRIFTSGNEIRYLKAMGLSLYDANGVPTRMIGVNWDITPLKQSEVSLRKALEKERELGELKSRFVSMASHEFRTPLATILSTTENLVRYRQRMDEAQIAERLSRIQQQVMHMTGIMEDVLHLARAQAGRIEFRPGRGDMDALCRDILDEFSSQEPNHGRILYTCDPLPLNVLFDARLMRQVISNLVSNALKYSQEEEAVHVHLGIREEQLVLTVRDQGIGIPEGDIRHLFEPFHRAANVGTLSGTGLGMSITKQAVDMHGGTITLETAVGQGTTVTVAFPMTVD